MTTQNNNLPFWHTAYQNRQKRASTKRVSGGTMSVTTQPSAQTVTEGAYFRWLQLAMGIVCMAMIANLQYGWTLFVDPIDAKYHWGRAAIQLAFTLFVVIETWLIPVEGYLVDRFGPRWVVIVGAVLIALAWVLNSYADSLVLLYV